MVSGSLFLARDYSLKKIFSKYILRITTAFFFWACVYSAVYYVRTEKPFEAKKLFFTGEYHMWFLFTIVGLYMIVPFMKKISESRFLTRYFLILALLISTLIPQAINILKIFLPDYGNIAASVFHRFNFHLPVGYSGYFLLGYVLSKNNFSKRKSRLIYAAGLCGVFVTVFMTAAVSSMQNKANGIFLERMTLNVLLESIAVFVFFKNNFSRGSKLIIKLSKYSFGAYLVHVWIIIILNSLGINSRMINPFLAIPVVSILTFVISFFISAILNNITYLKKYVV